MNLVNAIARYEGYGASTNNLPTRNNNPGNIVYGSFAANYGAVKDPNSNFAIFPDSTTGFQAMSDLLASPSYNNLSIIDAIRKWNGQGSNSSTYAQTVANWLGISPYTKVSDALNSDSNTSETDYSNTTTNQEPIDDLASSLSSNDIALFTGIGLIGLIVIKLFR